MAGSRAPTDITAITAAVRHVGDCVQRLEVAQRQLRLLLRDADLVAVGGRLHVVPVPLDQLRCIAQTRAGDRCRNTVELPDGRRDPMTGAFIADGDHARALVRQRCPLHVDGEQPDAAPPDRTPIPEASARPPATSR